MSIKPYYIQNRPRLKTMNAESCSYFEVILCKFFRCARPLIERPVATPGNVLLTLIVISVACHKVLTYALFYPIFRMVFGTLYPAYASYKAVRSRNVREYVKWMMYWIVFAIFSCIETFTDIFLSWFPFYYELKILLVIWLLAPATKGSSILYRKFVHPTLSNKEQEIDEYISKAKEQSYKQVLDLGTRGVSAIMQTAIKNLIPDVLLTAILSALGINVKEVKNTSPSITEEQTSVNPKGSKDATDNIGNGQKKIKILKIVEPRIDNYAFYDEEIFSDDDMLMDIDALVQNPVIQLEPELMKNGRPKRGRKPINKKTTKT